MFGLVEQYLSNPGWRDEAGRKNRQFAEETLAWPRIAQKHLHAYQELIA
jgi:glycosyltransferase involved in cell wall biosynthesis